MNLRQAFDRYNADKGYKHRYELIYEPYFEKVRDKEINILEIGVWKGAGMSAMHDYFSNANFVGVDIFSRIRPDEVEVFKRPRVSFVDGDSTNPSTVYHLLQMHSGIKFDIIIDDGAHHPQANKETFKNFSPLLKDDGVYFIEDVWPLERMTDDQLRHPWLTRWPERYDQIKNNSFLNVLLESGLEIKRHDNRKKTGEPDSYIISLSAYE